MKIYQYLAVFSKLNSWRADGLINDKEWADLAFTLQECLERTYTDELIAKHHTSSNSASSQPGASASPAAASSPRQL